MKILFVEETFGIMSGHTGNGASLSLGYFLEFLGLLLGISIYGANTGTIAR